MYVLVSWHVKSTNPTSLSRKEVFDQRLHIQRNENSTRKEVYHMIYITFVIHL